MVIKKGSGYPISKHLLKVLFQISQSDKSVLSGEKRNEYDKLIV